MKTLVLLLFALSLALPAVASETWENVALLDVMCQAKFKEKPGEHTKDCAVMCQDSGFGVLTADGDFLKLDDTGNARVKELLKSTKQKKDLRVTVSGKRDGDTIQVETIRL